ncbi:MAG: HAMP domain-containing histidine kinase [Muribaculaceae bacterium]|nr:HAMP domain-containing histidine kinase [Muribaculaceae bacterium]
MKFRYKVMLVNMLLLSACLGLAGYLMIRKNYELAQREKLQNAVLQNNLVQSMVEYELLQEINSGKTDFAQSLPRIGAQVAAGMRTFRLSLFIRYGDSEIYQGKEAQEEVPAALCENPNGEQKRYIISREGENLRIYVAAYSMVDGEFLCMITGCDATEIYAMMREEILYFRFLLMGILLAAAIVLYFLCRYLTGPLEKLDRGTEAVMRKDYTARVEVRSKDEVGQLAEKFNRMSCAVGEHVQRLEEMLRQRDQFVADFTHEIKTPMTAIIGYADTMRSMELPKEEQLLALNYIFSEGRRLEVLSQKLFELLYLRQNEMEFSFVSVEDLLQETADIMNPALGKKGQSLQILADLGRLYGEKELLVSAVCNLVDNAGKASGEGESIRILGKAKGQGYELVVEDHGIGISEEDCGKICDEFYMVDKSRARSEGGAGLGMSLVALILERHGAKLDIESRLGQGTRMRIFFPEREVKEKGGEDRADI